IITRRIRQVLLDTQVSFRRHERGVTQAELNLVQSGPAAVRKLRKRPPEVMRRHLDSDLAGIELDTAQDALSGQRVTRDVIALVDAAEHATRTDAGRFGPSIDRRFCPVRHRDSPDSTVLPDQIDDAPAAVPLLHVLEVQAGGLLASETAADE